MVKTAHPADSFGYRVLWLDVCECIISRKKTQNMKTNKKKTDVGSSLIKKEATICHGVLISREYVICVKEEETMVLMF